MKSLQARFLLRILGLNLLLLMAPGWQDRAVAQPGSYEFVCGSGPNSAATVVEAPENPVCSDPDAIRYLRVAVHFLLRTETLVETITDHCSSPVNVFTYVGPGNFTETNDGIADSGYNGFQHAEQVIGRANQMLANNQDHWRKASGQNYPTTPPDIRIQYLLVGVYFHRDPEAFAGAGSEKQIHAKYDVDANQVLDLYLIHNPALPYDGNAIEYAGANKFVFLNDYKNYLKPHCREWSILHTARSINHEIGHTLNLYHTWNEVDACHDTPLGFLYDKVMPDGSCLPDQIANCWTHDPGIPGCPDKPCDDWSKISNNIMDYNHWDPAWTSCQIARMNQNLAGNGHAYIHACAECAPPQAFFQVRSPQAICPQTLGGNPVMLNGQASVHENQYLIEICEGAESHPDNCIGGYFNTGWQSGVVDKVNLSALYSFQPNKVYRITLRVDNTDCPGSDVQEQWLYTTNDCTVQPPCCFEMAALNPFSDQLTVFYSTPEPGVLRLSLINLLSGQTTELFASSEVGAGSYQVDFQGSIPIGSYRLQAVFKGSVYTKSLLKL